MRTSYTVSVRLRVPYFYNGIAPNHFQLQHGDDADETRHWTVGNGDANQIYCRNIRILYPKVRTYEQIYLLIATVTND